MVTVDASGSVGMITAGKANIKIIENNLGTLAKNQNKNNGEHCFAGYRL